MAAADSPKVPGSRTDKAEDLWDNPAGTAGFEFVEYTAEDTQELDTLFRRLGFRVAGRHRSKRVTHYRQGDINFIVNAEPESFAQSFARVHGPSACAMAFRVGAAGAAFDRALSCGAKPHKGHVGPMELNIPAIKGIGDSLVYLVDRYGERNIYDVDFEPVEAEGRRRRRRRRQRQRRLRPDLHRPPDPQRLSRAHGPLGRLLREDLQFPGAALLRHRGQADRPAQPRHDLALRQDPHSDQRVGRRQVADRGIPRGLQGRGHPAHRAGHRRHLCDGRKPEGARHRIHGAAARQPTTRASTQRVPGHGEDVERLQRTASCSTAPRPRAAASCCRSSPSSPSARSSSRSSSARATRASAKATSRRSSNPWKRIRSAEACSIQKRLEAPRTRSEPGSRRTSPSLSPPAAFAAGPSLSQGERDVEAWRGCQLEP